MRKALAHVNAWMLDWKRFMTALLNECDETTPGSLEPEGHARS